MQCQFGSVWLTGLPWQESVTEAEWSFKAESEIIPIIGATEPAFVDRGNATDTLSIRVSRQFADAQAALEYAIDRPWSLPTKDSLTLTEGSMFRLYSNALLTQHNRRRYGSSVYDEYEFVVGAPNI